jgi:hypothetical protein
VVPAVGSEAPRWASAREAFAVFWTASSIGRDEMKLRFLPISHCRNYLSAVPVAFGAADRTLSLGPMSSCIGFFGANAYKRGGERRTALLAAPARKQSPWAALLSPQRMDDHWRKAG